MPHLRLAFSNLLQIIRIIFFCVTFFFISFPMWQHCQRHSKVFMQWKNEWKNETMNIILVHFIVPFKANGEMMWSEVQWRDRSVAWQPANPPSNTVVIATLFEAASEKSRIVLPVPIRKQPHYNRSTAGCRAICAPSISTPSLCVAVTANCPFLVLAVSPSSLTPLPLLDWSIFFILLFWCQSLTYWIPIGASSGALQSIPIYTGIPLHTSWPMSIIGPIDFVVQANIAKSGCFFGRLAKLFAPMVGWLVAWFVCRLPN